MKPYLLLLPTALLLGACAGDNNTTHQSAPQAPRSAVSRKSGAPGGTLFSRSRVYEITRLQTADQPRGEWRALGESIREQGSAITFTELGSGKTVSFIAPHQITATNSMGDRSPVQGNSDNPNDPSQIPAARQ